MSLDLLTQRLAEAGASLAQPRGPAHLARLLLESAGSGLIILEDHPWLRAAAAYFPSDPAPAWQFLTPDAWPDPLAVDTLICVGLGAVPETGSVLLTGGSPPAFRLSLCPRRQIMVIPADQAQLTLAQALDLTAREPSGLVSWLTGPSRTADIEKVLVLGAQGAAELLVLLYQDA